MSTSPSRLTDAVKHLQAGDWEAAHLIAQADESDLGSWVHGIVHLMEGDESNAGYWYRKAHRLLPHTDAAAAIDVEIEALSQALSAV